jgi:hypothetical protein
MFVLSQLPATPPTSLVIGSCLCVLSLLMLFGTREYTEPEKVKLGAPIPGSRLISLRRVICPSVGPLLSALVRPATIASLSSYTLLTVNVCVIVRPNNFDPPCQMPFPFNN